MRLKLLIGAVALLAANTSFAKGFVKMPVLDGETDTLQIKFVKYTGGTNGEMIVDVRNTGTTRQSFNPEGLYFVPNGNPETSPQRLGAAGPFKASQGSMWTEHEKVYMQAGETRRLHLQVYCIDSHRSSPSAQNTFRIAKKRVPKKLRQEISTGTKRLIRAEKGNANKAKSAIQSHVWKSRDADWIKLEGERAVEKSPPRQRKRHNRHRNQQQLNID